MERFRIGILGCEYDHLFTYHRYPVLDQLLYDYAAGFIAHNSILIDVYQHEIPH